MKYLLLLLFLLSSSITSADSCVDSVLPKFEEKSEVSSYIDSLKGTVLFSGEEVQGSYCHIKSWYSDRMSSRQFSSRMLAVLIIVLGASLPLIVILDEYFINQKFWIAFIGAAIVIGQGFSQTFQYEESWRNYTVAMLELESTHRRWQKRIIDASLNENGLFDAQKQTEVFANSVSIIVMKETTGFFETLSEPIEKLKSELNGTQ